MTFIFTGILIGTRILEYVGADFFDPSLQFTLNVFSNVGRHYHPHEVMSFAIPENLNCVWSDNILQRPEEDEYSSDHDGILWRRRHGFPHV